jgi:hypothetical protein
MKEKVTQMGWEKRSGQLYYTRSRKVNGRVMRDYMGGGALGELAAAADALRRADRWAEREALRAEEARWQEALTPLLELIHVTDLLTRATLLVAGYHQHARTWRKKRHVGNERNTPEPGLRSTGAPGEPGAKSATG